MKVAVKALAEFVHNRGDLRVYYESAALAEEGIARQKEWQRDRGDAYLREHRVEAQFGDFAVSGRIDGWAPGEGLVEEVKTTRADPAPLHARVGGVHWAQLRLYAAMLVLADENLGSLRLRLIYLHPTDSAETAFEEAWARDDLVAYFEATCGVFAAWIGLVQARLGRRNVALKALRFPYPQFRPDQRRLAKHVYRALRDGVDWLMEAPTGSGKTMASLFPALKAMGERQSDRLVFLTSRTTGQRAIETALAEVLPGTELVAVTVTAKERICFNADGPCDPEQCSYAKGYYERMRPARRELLDGGLADRPSVEAVARVHRVCPFELSLDVAAWADVVVCDYNYVFDPVVRLKRLFNEALHPAGRRVGLIVDEAHQLGERVRDMLSAMLPRSAAKAALREPALPKVAAQRFRSVDRALAATAKETDGAECEVSRPEGLRRALMRFSAMLADATVDLDPCPAAADARWQLLRFERAMDWAVEGNFRYLASGAGAEVAVEVACTVPGGHIRTTMDAFHGTVRLSGTLTPPAVFQRIHGFADDAPFLRSAGGFDPARLGVFVVPDLSTYYRDRRRTLPQLAQLIRCVRAATPGNCLVAFPSFEYLDAVAALGGEHVRWQAPGMEAPEREDFIAWLGERADKPRLGLVVMGGVFAESVDFDSRALQAVVVVGPGPAAAVVATRSDRRRRCRRRRRRGRLPAAGHDPRRAGGGPGRSWRSARPGGARGLAFSRRRPTGLFCRGNGTFTSFRLAERHPPPSGSGPMTPMRPRRRSWRRSTTSERGIAGTAGRRQARQDATIGAPHWTSAIVGPCASSSAPPSRPAVLKKRMCRLRHPAPMVRGRTCWCCGRARRASPPTCGRVSWWSARCCAIRTARAWNGQWSRALSRRWAT